MRLLQILFAKCMPSSSIFGNLHYASVSPEDKRYEKLLGKMFLWKAGRQQFRVQYKKLNQVIKILINMLKNISPREIIAKKCFLRI